MKNLKKIFQNIFRTSALCLSIALLPFGVYQVNALERVTENVPVTIVEKKSNKGCESTPIKSEQIVYITKTGKCFHANSHQCLKNSRIAISLEKAVENGYKKCSKCFA